MSRFKKYIKEHICHHERYICRNCGDISTCRCSQPKKDIYIDSCINCKE